MVGLDGLEPSTSRLSGARSNLLSYRPVFPFPFRSSKASRGFAPSPYLTIGGDDGIRTHDPLLAGQVLSQLSYTPVSRGFLVSSGTLSDSRRCWHRPIFPCSRPQSIVGTAKLNFCVRNGNRWTLCVNDTNFFFSESVLILKIEQQSFFGLSSNRSKIRNSLV